MTNPGYVYFIKEQGTPFIKIGWAKVPCARLKELQVGNPRKLELETTIPGTTEAERSLHRQFVGQRVRMRGEWYWLQGDLVPFIERVKRDAGRVHWAT